jgi:hypothetical protein
LIKTLLSKLAALFGDEKFKRDLIQDLQVIAVAVMGIVLLLLFISLGGMGGKFQQTPIEVSPSVSQEVK